MPRLPGRGASTLLRLSVKRAQNQRQGRPAPAHMQACEVVSCNPARQCTAMRPPLLLGTAPCSL